MDAVGLPWDRRDHQASQLDAPRLAHPGYLFEFE